MRKNALGFAAVLAIVAGCSDAEANDESTSAEAQQPETAASTEAVPAVQGPDLAPVLDFAKAETCQWSEAAERIFEEDTVFGDDYVSRPGTVTIPGLADPVTAVLSRPEPEYPDYVEVQLDFTGEWNGLQVVGLSDAFLEESGGVFARGIRFAAPVAEVASAMAAAGFNVNADGSERSVPLEGADFSRGDMAITSVEADGADAVFYCNQVFEGI
jgi:hypothetical protein